MSDDVNNDEEYRTLMNLLKRRKYLRQYNIDKIAAYNELSEEEIINLITVKADKFIIDVTNNYYLANSKASDNLLIKCKWYLNWETVLEYQDISIDVLTACQDAIDSFNIRNNLMIELRNQTYLSEKLSKG